MYHSFAGDTYISGSPRVTGCDRSSTTSFAGSGGQLFVMKTACRKSSTNHGQCVLSSLYPAKWKPSQAPPCFMYCSKAVRCAFSCGESFSHPHLVSLQVGFVQIIPIGRNMPVKVVTLRLSLKESDCLPREVDVVGFRFLRIESEHVKPWLLSVQD